MQPDLIELARRLANLVRLGTVAHIDAAQARIRVQSGALLTDWLPWLATRAGTTATWSLPSIGEQVLLLAPSGDPAQAVALPALYSNAAPAPSTSPAKHLIKFPDGAVIGYDSAAGHLDVTGVVNVTVHAAGSITLDSPLTLTSGALTVQGLLTYQAGLAGTGGGTGTTINGPITQTGGALSSNGITLGSHTHTGVQTGSGSTGGPQ